MRQWVADLALGHFKLFLKIKFHFFTQFLAKSPFKLLLLFSLQLKIKSNSLLTVWYALRPSQQPTVSPNYSQSIKINIGPSDARTIVPSTNHPTVLYWRLLDFLFLCGNKSCYYPVCQICHPVSNFKHLTVCF